MADIATLGLRVDSSGIVRATRDLNKLEREGRDAERQTDKLNRSFGGLKTAALALGTAIAAIGITRIIKSAADATLAMDSINSSLRVATGSTEAAAMEFAFLREEAERLGLDLQASASAFGSLAAAARGTAIEGQAARDIFVAVSEAMTALGRTSAETEGALTAIEQMISKGRVSAEELRGQLGERLPGAFQIAARSIGVTTQELDKMLSNGELLAEDLLPRFAQELSNTFSAEAEARANGLQAEMNRFRTAVFELMSSGNMDGLARAIEDVTSLIKDPAFQQGFAAFVGGTIRLGGFLAERAAAVGAFFTDSLTEQSEEAIKIVQDLERQLENTRNPQAQLRIKAELAEARMEAERLQALIWGGGQSINNAPVALDSPSTSSSSMSSTSSASAPASADLGPVIRIPEDTITTVDLIAERYEELQGIAERLSNELRTPQEIYQQEIELLNELRDTRKQGTDDALISYEDYVRGVEAAQMRLANSTQSTADEMTEFMEEAARNIQNILADNLFDFMQGEFDFTADSFKKMLDRMVAEAIAADLGKKIFGKGLAGGGLLDKGINFVTGLFGAGGPSGADLQAMNAIAPSSIPSLSFDGGGYTGSGSRSGGLDGKGGFPAMLHPNETVVDHSKGQSMGGMTINVNITGVRDGRDIRESADQAAMKLMAAGQRAMQRNG